MGDREICFLMTKIRKLWPPCVRSGHCCMQAPCGYGLAGGGLTLGLYFVVGGGLSIKLTTFYEACRSAMFNAVRWRIN